MVGANIRVKVTRSRGLLKLVCAAPEDPLLPNGILLKVMQMCTLPLASLGPSQRPTR